MSLQLYHSSKLLNTVEPYNLTSFLTCALFAQPIWDFLWNWITKCLSKRDPFSQNITIISHFLCTYPSLWSLFHARPLFIFFSECDTCHRKRPVVSHNMTTSFSTSLKNTHEPPVNPPNTTFALAQKWSHYQGSTVHLSLEWKTKHIVESIPNDFFFTFQVLRLYNNQIKSSFLPSNSGK